MSTLANRQSSSKPAVQRGYRPTCALATSVQFDGEMMHVFLTDGRTIGVPIIWFPLLQKASPSQRENCEIHGGGVSLHWPEIDEDISVAGLLDGADWQST